MATIAFLFALVIPFLVTLTASSAIHSTVPANPLPYRTTQPDGSMTPQLQFWGDGTDNFVSDENGYVVVKDGGWLVYAQNEASIDSTESDERKSLRSRRLGKSSGSSHLVPSQHVVGSVDPSALSGLTTVQQRKIHSQKHRRLHQDTVVTPHQPRKLFTNTTGATFQFQSLILLLRFADHTDRELPTASQFIKFYNKRDLSLTNNDIAPTGSINELFWENSYGMLDARAKVVDWITLSETEEYYANGEYGFQKFLEGIQEALGQLFEGNELEDIERIDGLGILHSGYGAEYGGEDCFGQENVNRIWSHQAGSLKFVNPHSNFDTGKDDAEQGIGALVVPERYYVASALRNKCGSEITRVGIVAHEMGHQLGLPDLYDKTFAGNGAGNYDPMSKSWGE
jgi:M6 family metalloprotease-like protein